MKATPEDVAKAKEYGYASLWDMRASMKATPEDVAKCRSLSVVFWYLTPQ